MKKAFVLSVMMLFVGASVAPVFAAQNEIVNNDKGDKGKKAKAKTSENKPACCQAKAAAPATCPMTGQSAAGDQKPCHAGKAETTPAKK